MTGSHPSYEKKLPSHRGAHIPSKPSLRLTAHKYTGVCVLPHSMLLPLSHTSHSLNIPRFSHVLTLTTHHIHMCTPPTCPPQYSPPVSSRANRWFCALKSGKGCTAVLSLTRPDCARPGAATLMAAAGLLSCTPSAIRPTGGPLPTVWVPPRSAVDPNTQPPASGARQASGSPRLPIRSEPWAQPPGNSCPQGPQREWLPGQASSRPG